MWGEPLAATRARIDEMKALAVGYGRELRYNISFRTIIGRTETQAWDVVDQLMKEMKEQLGDSYAERIVSLSESVGQRRLYDQSCNADVLDTRLFMGFTKIMGAQGNSSALVGTVDQIVESLIAYVRLGITSFVLRGWSDEEHAPEYTGFLVRALRHAVYSQVIDA
jgi:alkanesulfonate monooxygenase